MQLMKIKHNYVKACFGSLLGSAKTKLLVIIVAALVIPALLLDRVPDTMLASIDS